MVADDTGVLALIRGSEAGLTVKVLGRPGLADYDVTGYQHASTNFERNAAVQKDYNTRESTALANMDEYKRIIENNTLKSDDRFLTSYQMAHGHHHDTSVFPTANFPIQRVEPALKHENYKSGINRHCGTFYVRRTPNYNYWPNQGVTYGCERSTANRDLEAFENSLRKYDYVPLTPSKSADYTHRTHSKRRTSTRSKPRRAKTPNPTTVKPDTAYKLPDTAYKPPDTTYKPPDTTYKLPDTTYKPPDTAYKPPEVQIPKLTQSPHTIADSDLMFDYLRAERQYRQSNRRVYFDLSCPLMLSEARLRNTRLGGCGPYDVTMCRKLLQRYQRHLNCCPKSEVELAINSHIEVWQNEIPVYPDESREQRCTRHRMINKLREDLISIPNGPAFLELARQITKECVDTLPMWLPQESSTAFKERIAQSLLNRLNDRILLTVQANTNLDMQSINNSLLDVSNVIDAGPRNGLSSGCEVCDRRGTVSECVGCDQRSLNSGNATDGQLIPEMCDRPVCDCGHENHIPTAVRQGSNVSEEAGPSKKKTKDKSIKGKPASPRTPGKKRKSSSKVSEHEKSISDSVRINSEKQIKGNANNDNANSVSENGNDNLDNTSVTVKNDDNRMSQILNGDNISPESESLNIYDGNEVAETVINSNGNQISEIVNGNKENRASQIINKVHSENLTLNKSKTLNGNETSNSNKISENSSDSYENGISRSLQNNNNGNLISDTVNNEIVNSNSVYNNNSNGNRISQSLNENKRSESFSNNDRESLMKNTDYNNRHSIEEIDNYKGNPISPTSKQNMTSETTTADNLIEKRTSKISNGKNKSDTSNNGNWISATTIDTNANQVSDNVNNGYENRVSEIVSDTNGKRNSGTIHTNSNRTSEILNNDNRNRLSQILNGNQSPDLVNNNGNPISPKSNQNTTSETTTNNRNRMSDILNNSDDNQVMNSYININSENACNNTIEKCTSKLCNGNNKSENVNSSNGNWISATTNDTNTNQVSDNVNNGNENRISEIVSNTKRNSDSNRTSEILSNNNRNSPSQILNGNRSADLGNNINGNHSPDLVNNNSGNRSPDNHSLDKWISDNIYRNCDKCITDGVNTCPGHESPPRAQDNQEPPISCAKERCILETAGRNNKSSKTVNRSPPNETDGNYKKWISETVVRDYERLLSDTVARDTSKRPSLATPRDYQKRISDMIENNSKRVSATVSRNIKNLQGSTRDFEKMLLNRIPQNGGRRNAISGARDFERSLLETTFGGRRASKSAPIDKRLSDNMVRNRRVSETAQTIGFDTSDRDTEYDTSMVPQIVEANKERNANTVTERRKMELPSKLNPIPEMDKESEISGSEIINQAGSNNNNDNVEPARPNRQDIENQIWDTISNTPELANINRSDVTDLVNKLASDLSYLTEDQMEEKEKIVIQFVQNLSRQVECAGCFMDPKIRYKIITKLLIQSLDIENEIWDIISAIKDLSHIPKCDITVLVRTLAGNLRTLTENKASDDEKENEIMQFLRKLAVKTGCHLCLLDPNIRDTFVTTLLNNAPTTDELNNIEAEIWSAVGDLPEVLNMPKCLLDSKVKALARSLASNKNKYAKMVIDIVTFLQYVNCKTGCKINSKRRDDFCQNLMNVLLSQTKAVSAKSGVVHNNNKNGNNNLNCSFKCAFTTDSYINEIYDKNENETTRLLDKCLVTFIARLPFEICDSEYFKTSIKSGILDWFNYVDISPSKHSDNEKYNGIKYLVFKRLKDATNTKDAVLALEHIECLIGQLKEIQTLRKDESISNKMAPEVMEWTNVGLSTVADGDLVNKLQQNESKFASKTVQTDSKGCRRRRSTVSFDENSDQSNKATNTDCKRNTSKHRKGKSVSATNNNENICSDDEDDKNTKINNTIKVVTKIKKKRDFPIQTIGDLTRLSAEQQSISKYLAENKQRFLDDDFQQSIVPRTDTLLDDIEPEATPIPPEDYNIDFFIGCKHTKCKSRKPMKLNQIFIDNNVTCSLKTDAGPWKSKKESKSLLGMSPKNSWYATVGHIEPGEQKSRPRRPLVKTCQGVKLDQSFELKKQRYRNALGLKIDCPFVSMPKTCDCKQSVINCHKQCPYPSNMFFQP